MPTYPDHLLLGLQGSALPELPTHKPRVFEDLLDKSVVEVSWLAPSDLGYDGVNPFKGDYLNPELRYVLSSPLLQACI